MPNHVENDLWIDGPKARVAELLKLIGAGKKKPEFDFKVVIPYPEKFAALDRAAGQWEKDNPEYWKHGKQPPKDGYNQGGYEWCIDNWGTKWGAYDVARRDYDGKVCVTFQTAWSPPRPVIAALHKLFPDLDLSLEWFEGGSCFSGGMTFLSESEWKGCRESEPFVAGVPSERWEAKYQGNRGG